jgi:hypothetical protein
MQAEQRRFAESWSDAVVPGTVIQIRGESILFKPRAATHPLWLFLGGEDPPPVGDAQVIVNPAVFRCKRVILRRGEAVKVPRLEFHNDELEGARGHLRSVDEAARCFVLDVGFPLVVSLLENCQELLRARPGEILELEFAPPAQGHLS